jgi:hypothetical protein
MPLFFTLRRPLLARSVAALVLLLISVGLAACGPEEAPDAESGAEAIAIRSPHPTFTPTPPTLAASAPAAATHGPGVDPPVVEVTTPPTPGEPPPAVVAGSVKLVINTDLVNLREGPGTQSTIITILQKGQEFDIIGKDVSGAWWFVCCLSDKAGWVTSEFADVSGPAETVPVVADNASSALAPPFAQAGPATAAPMAVALAATPPPTAMPSIAEESAETSAPTSSPQGGLVEAAAAGYEFDLIAQEQFPESRVVRIFLYVFDETNALEGYSLAVKKDGAELPVGGVSFGPNSAFTWPVADPRQRAQNFKVEFANTDPAGQWEVQLTLDGVPVGPPAHFVLAAGEPNQELYVRYVRH